MILVPLVFLGCSRGEPPNVEERTDCERYDDGDLLQDLDPAECQSDESLRRACRILTKEWNRNLDPAICRDFETLLRDSNFTDPETFFVLSTQWSVYRCEGQGYDIIEVDSAISVRRDKAWFDHHTGELIALRIQPDRDDSPLKDRPYCCDGSEVQAMWWGEPVEDECTARYDYVPADFPSHTGDTGAP